MNEDELQYELGLQEEEEDRISQIPISMWRKKILLFVSKLLNVRDNYPYRWSCKGINYDLVNGKLIKK